MNGRSDPYDRHNDEYIGRYVSRHLSLGLIYTPDRFAENDAWLLDGDGHKADVLECRTRYDWGWHKRDVAIGVTKALDLIRKARSIGRSGFWYGVQMRSKPRHGKVGVVWIDRLTLKRWDTEGRRTYVKGELCYEVPLKTGFQMLGGVDSPCTSDDPCGLGGPVPA